MKKLKKDLESIVKSLNLLSQKTEKMIARLDKTETPKAAKSSKPKAGKSPASKKDAAGTSTDVVLKAIKRNKNGVDTTTLQEKTGFNEIKVRNIIFRLKKQEKIQSRSRGVYVAV